MQDNYWKERAKCILKAELARQNMGYKDLALLLESVGINETYISITNKVSRGTFSFAFFLQCMNVLNVKQINI